ncbi:DUF3667 domain-containing protein [Dokdonia sinensis]|uniref:DUF3667 domain-containing protein n=1 Tax=Dokdonia sinensis TaxID=2479847 RepID=A0A3M0GG25_9FLAO|nr:DUF3667 domain-containing protein [Dokdonia sinensis]RMB56276.1 DUF3667 domain-containing protein [Dokdonia sinensis]
MGKLSKAERKALKKESRLLEITETCINCEEKLALDQRFCNYCGGKRIYNRLTWRNLFEDFVDRFLNLENSFLRTFVAMFRQPEDVIGGYMNGMRKKYLPAFSYFAIAVTIAGFSAFILQNYYIDDFIQAQIDAQVTMFQDEPTQQLQQEFLQGWLKEYMAFVLNYQSLIYFCSIPLLALISRIVFWNYRKYNFVEHLVIYLYSYSHIVMIILVVGMLLLWNQTLYQMFSMISFVIMIIYTAYVLKRLFNLSSGSLVLKTAFFALVSGAVVLLLSFVFLGVVVSKALSDDPSDSQFIIMMRKSIEMGKEKARAQKAKDSLVLDSLERNKLHTSASDISN